MQFSGQPLGLLFAFANCGLFVLYVILGHRIAQNTETSSIDRLGAAMVIALVVVSPIGFMDATAAFAQPDLLLAGIGVGICSSVIPYVLDQLAMSRLPRATFALLLSLLPAFATMIGVLVLGQVPTVTELAGIGMIIGGVAVHQEGERFAIERTPIPDYAPGLPKSAGTRERAFVNANHTRTRISTTRRALLLANFT